jgi:ABC-type bacteriocin/lantibiotic exporter with double-glycine peptidase domain
MDDDDPGRLRLVPQRDDWDCGIAALATLFAVSYDTVADVVDRHIAAKHEGLFVTELVAIAAVLGYRLQAVGAVEGRVSLAAHQAAILGVLIEAGLTTERAHWAVVHGGHVWCPTGARAPLHDYLARHRAEPFALLVAA